MRIAAVDNGAIYYVHTDHLGAPLALTDSNGTVQWKGSYDPYGNVTVEINNLDQSQRFPGQYADEETGLYQNYFRDYDPEIGRYIQSDPIGLNGGINTYGYVGANPVGYIDPLGLNGRAVRTTRGRVVNTLQPLTNLRYRELMIEIRQYDPAFSTARATNSPVTRSEIRNLEKLLRNAKNAGFCGPGASSGRYYNTLQPNFIVDASGTAFPVPQGAAGPVPVVNNSGNITGSAFTGGAGGANGQVSTIRLMNPTPARGNNPSYPNGYIKYGNNNGQGVDPYTGRTIPNSQNHFPIRNNSGGCQCDQ